MDFSLNEIETLVRKAALGAGLDPGRASDLAAAAVWLTARPVPVCDVLHRALEASAGSPLAIAPDNSAATCPQSRAAHVTPAALDLLCARPAGFEVILDAVDEPLLVAALAAVTAERQPTAITLSTDTATLRLEPGHAPSLDALADCRAPRLVLRRLTEPAPAPAENAARPSRYDPARTGDTGLDGLERLAHRTYVPASEASRLTGAGAGLTDND